MKPAAAPVVLHLAVDYPNLYRPENTLAVRNFVDAAAGPQHLVVALTRSANPFAVAAADGDGQGDARIVSMRYWGLPFGLLLALSMFIVALRVRLLLARRGLRPLIVHAHKFSFEGLAGWWLARWARVPLVLSVRGEAESKVLRYKPLYRPLLQRVLQDAARIYYVSAWFRPLMRRHFRVADAAERLLPNFVARPAAAAVGVPHIDRLVTVLDLNVYRKKGLDRLLPALLACRERYPRVHLDIVGRGSVEATAEVRHLIERLGLDAQVSLIGPLGHAELLARLPSYAGLVLPSHNETFGMVYVEALLACVPILHSRGTGIDGFVDFVEARVAVDPMHVAAVAAGLERLLAHQGEWREWLKTHRAQVAAEFDQRRYVVEYLELVGQCA
ncbi:MAG: glycosyltransferase [Rhodocyclaceae bacterium]|nr:glycosyltransferase [Rhodocyclaceae bacterium]